MDLNEFYLLRQGYLMEYEDFASNVLKSIKPVVLFLWGDWCNPCQEFKPRFKNVQSLFSPDDVSFYDLNVSSVPEIVSEYGIRSIPSLLLFRDGKVVDRIAGSVSEGFLEDKISSVFSIKASQKVV